MKKNIIVGFNVTCVGDNRCVSFLPSRAGNTYADSIALAVLQRRQPDFVQHSFLDRGSDERQYCSPGVDLPVVSIMRSKYGTYPEYHTSLDNLSLISADGLAGSYNLLKECLEIIESGEPAPVGHSVINALVSKISQPASSPEDWSADANKKYKITCYGEPQLGRRGLYPNVSTKDSARSVKAMMDFIAYADGTRTVLNISQIIGVPVKDLHSIIDQLENADLLTEAQNWSTKRLWFHIADRILASKTLRP